MIIAIPLWGKGNSCVRSGPPSDWVVPQHRHEGYERAPSQQPPIQSSPFGSGFRRLEGCIGRVYHPSGGQRPCWIPRAALCRSPQTHPSFPWMQLRSTSFCTWLWLFVGELTGWHRRVGCSEVQYRPLKREWPVEECRWRTEITAF